MGSFLAKFVASEYAGHVLEENFGPENPKYDYVVTDDGRRRKIKKLTPPGLTAHDERVLHTVRRKAWRYEWWVDCHCCCGVHVQFGTVTMWGLLPVVGDFIALLNALSLIRAARRVDGGLPAFALVAMLAWAAVDFAVKLVPIVGEVVTAIVKPNTRNAMRLEALLAARGAKRWLPLSSSSAGVHARVGPPVPAGTAVAAGASDDPRARLLVVSAQPEAQRGMSVGAGAGAGSSYGTVRAGAGAEQLGRPGRGRQEPRHWLPFWKRNEDSDED